ncbi:hypothetical protein BDZ89DRAFT_1134839 [Hymenopellis radicata]|nr:hypothetical protein BDZ89DRAFT_1134839 [Hymenopellis radicata]
MSNTQTQSSDDEKDWKGLKLTPIKVEEDGTNNFTEFKRKAEVDLEAAGYWRYVDGPDYKPPIIPELRRTVQVQGIDSTGAAGTLTVPGNEADVETAKKKAEDWLLADKKALSVILKAIPIRKLFVVQNCHTAHDTWCTLKKEFEPANAVIAVTLHQQITGFRCQPGDDPVHWCEVMFQLYGKLQDADPNAMTDTEFARQLITLMTDSEDWRYCRTRFVKAFDWEMSSISL